MEDHQHIRPPMGLLISDSESCVVVGLGALCKSESTWTGVIPTEKHPINYNATEC